MMLDPANAWIVLSGVPDQLRCFFPWCKRILTPEFIAVFSPGIPISSDIDQGVSPMRIQQVAMGQPNLIIEQVI
jgi:hypothetical protein